MGWPDACSPEVYLATQFPIRRDSRRIRHDSCRADGRPNARRIAVQTVSLNGAAFTAIDADGANLLLTATSDVVPVIAEYASLAPDRGLSVFICGEEFPNFQPTPRAAFGELVIPLSTRQPQPAPHLSWPGKSVAMTLRRRSHPRPPLQVFFRRHPWRMTRPLTCPTMTYW